MPILFNRFVPLQVDPITSTFARSIISSSQWCLLLPFQVVFVFPPSHPYFFKDADFLNKYPFYYCEVSPFFPSMFLSGDYHEDGQEFQVHHSSFYFFSGGSNLVLSIISFPRF